MLIGFFALTMYASALETPSPLLTALQLVTLAFGLVAMVIPAALIDRKRSKLAKSVS